MRFDQIYDWLEKNKPETIVEIGTWNGRNAIAMMKASGAKKYVGFDVWEEGSDQLDEIEFNVKQRVSKKDVEKSIGDKFEYELVQGNTRVTLSEYCKDRKPFADVVVIDGGHSTPTIANDFKHAIKMAKSDGAIFLDDYYYGIPGPVGANAVLGQLHAPYTVLPKFDPVFKNKEKVGSVKLAQVNMRDLKITDRWEISEEESWVFDPQSQSS